MKSFIVILISCILNQNLHASEDSEIDYEYFVGTWVCKAIGKYADGMIVEVVGNVQHYAASRRYDYKGTLKSYYERKEIIYSELFLELSGDYELNSLNLRTTTDQVVISPGVDSLQLHSKDFLSGFKERLKENVDSEITIINANKYRSVVTKTGEVNDCEKLQAI